MRNRIGLLLLVAMFILTTTATPAEAKKKKSAVASGLLSGLVGFGTGHYYAGEAGKGAFFTLSELGLLAGAAATDDGASAAMYLAVFGIRIYEIVDGIGAADRHNEKHGLDWVGGQQPNFGLGFSADVLGDFGSPIRASLWEAGGASRELAIGYSHAFSSGAPFKLNLGAADLGIGCSWTGAF